jgi:hypothetical protein
MAAAMSNVLWIIIAVILFVGAFSARLIIRPGRAHIWSTPKALGLAYEDVTFEAQDGVPLVGWFIPAETRGAAWARRRTTSSTTCQGAGLFI